MRGSSVVLALRAMDASASSSPSLPSASAATMAASICASRRTSAWAVASALSARFCSCAATRAEMRGSSVVLALRSREPPPAPILLSSKSVGRPLQMVSISARTCFSPSPGNSVRPKAMPSVRAPILVFGDSTTRLICSAVATKTTRRSSGSSSMAA